MLWHNNDMAKEIELIQLEISQNQSFVHVSFEFFPALVSYPPTEAQGGPKIW